MELSEARAAVQQLLNLHAGLKKMQDVLDVAAAADQALSEKQALVAAKAKELDALAAQVDAAKTAEASRSQEAEKAHLLRLKEQDAQFESVANSFASVQARLETDTKAMQAAHDAAGDKLAVEIRELTQTRDALTQSVSTLQAQLAQLKDRAAAL